LYFDHNATTAVLPEVADRFAAAVRDIWGNPSSIHSHGQMARHRLETCRRTLAALMHATPPEMVFTSGGTESDNLALLGLIRSLPVGRKHVITTSIEHPAVLAPCEQLGREGVEVTVVPVRRDGTVDPEAVKDACRPDTVLVSIMHANNETGCLQPLAEIGAWVHERRQAGRQIFLHSDGVQAFGRVPVDMQALKVDLYSASAHKLGAPKGTGLLYVRKGTPLTAVQFGGRHERERRAGTENVPGAVAFAKAAELAAGSNEKVERTWRDRFETQILAALDDIEVNGGTAERLPNTSNVCFNGVSGESLVIALDMRGIAVSSGSACSSGSIAPSHVLLAMGHTPERARSSVRFSFGPLNTAEDVGVLIESTVECVGRLRKTVRREKQLAG
jgi:cysteine desulfurase